MKNTILEQDMARALLDVQVQLDAAKKAFMSEDWRIMRWRVKDLISSSVRILDDIDRMEEN